MLVLALDTSLARCSVAICRSEQAEPAAQITEIMQRGHAEALSGLITAAQYRAGIKLCDIDRIAVTTGPGSFTGVRTALAMAKGLALTLRKPVIGISTLEVIAAASAQLALQSGRPLLVALDARRDELYCQAFDKYGTALSEPGIYPVAAISTAFAGQAWLVAGTGAAAAAEQLGDVQLSTADPLPDTGFLARLAMDKSPGDYPAKPLYLRRPDAKPQPQAVSLTQADIGIVPADCSYAELLHHLHDQCFAKAWPPAEMKSLLQTSGIVAVLAIQAGDEAPLGFAMARKAGDEAEILTMGVIPQRRRRQTGERLLLHLLEQLGRHGTANVFLEVDKENIAALALYQKLGFDRAGERKAYYKGNNASSGDAWVMRCQIPVKQ